MSQDELFLALDRLTRFKHPMLKYKRVFHEILAANLIQPKFSLKKISELSSQEISKTVEKIWNDSIEHLIKKNNLVSKNNNHINKIIQIDENNLYEINNETKILLNTNLNIDDLLKLPCDYKTQPINIQRLIQITNNIGADFKKLREEKNLKFPIEKIIITEGITEEILLPVFAEISDYNFDKYGVHLISAGGKNQTARWYIENKDFIKVPVFILLDSDAEEIKTKITGILNPKDQIHLIEQGEFEDIISKKIILKTINDNYKNEFNIKSTDLDADMPMCKILTELLKMNGIGDFKKADFSKKVRDCISHSPEISKELTEIISKIKSL